MLREIDTRYHHNSNDHRSFREFEGKVNPVTGSPALLVLNTNTFHHNKSSLIDQAMEAVTSNYAALGFSKEPMSQGVQFLPDINVIKTSANTSIVHLHQVYRGIPVYQMSRTCRFTTEDTLEDIVGDNLDIKEDINLIPEMDVKSAMIAANDYINKNQIVNGNEVDKWKQPIPQKSIDTTKYIPEILVAFPTPARYTVLDKGVFEENIPAHLVIFPQYPAEARLAWRIVITLKETFEQYEIIVAANEKQSGEILLCKGKSSHIRAQGKVFEFNGGEERRMIPFPRPITDYPVKPVEGLPNDFPNDWVEEAGETRGNSTEALFCDSNSSTIECSPGTDLKGEIIDGILTFNPPDAEDPGNDQKVLNIFYFCNYMHDFFYLLGFTENEGNFQKVNFSGLGLEGDNVKAHAFSGPVYGTANMSTSVDGQSPIMRMGLVNSSNRHTAFDADVVFHEYTHGVTNRLVGGPMDHSSLDWPQSGGMGEAWSDYFALTIQNFSSETEKVVTGSWVFNNSEGIRDFKYDDHFPDHFGKLGTGRYNEVHNIGEIWCATLMYLNRRMVEKFGKDKGYNLTWRIVIDSLKLSRSNPSFLDVRDDIFKALSHLRAADKLSENDFKIAKYCAWQAFCKFGMGPNARSNGATLSGIVADFEIPVE
ncbi:M36 family metallopeptidase [Bacillus cereus]|uniref:M36 family metallopeptidase n=1 Tax=Bacillus cereus TaxID=1396 RepID=UPI0005CEA30B|nr:M36 family metallopeptidase [Bacillus cereus]